MSCDSNSIMYRPPQWFKASTTVLYEVSSVSIFWLTLSMLLVRLIYTIKLLNCTRTRTIHLKNIHTRGV